MDDVFAALRDGTGDGDRLTHQSLAVFGLCSLPGQPSGSLLLELAWETGRRQELGRQVLHPVGGAAAAPQTRLYLLFVFNINRHVSLISACDGGC